MSKYPPITKYMATKLITFSPDTDIMVAIDIFLKKKISGAPVLNDNNELVGMLSEADCLRVILQAPYNEVPASMNSVAHYMSTAVKTISGDKTIFDAAYEFAHANYKRLPVVDHEGKLIGQISRIDILRAIQNLKPTVKRVPDSWKGREPVLPEYKKTTYKENS
jgi:predicted transcriptional regulator